MPPPQRKKPPAASIALINMGRMPHTALRVIAANIQTVLGAPVDMLPAMVIPEEAFQRHRCQYDAGLVLKHLARFSFPITRAFWPSRTSTFALQYTPLYSVKRSWG